MTLYNRLGGYDAIASFVDEFLGRIGADDSLARFFRYTSDDTKRRARQLTIDFVCHAAGGNGTYLGRSMEQSHRGMGITQQDWQRTLHHLDETMRSRNLPADLRTAVRALIADTESGIVDPV